MSVVMEVECEGCSIVLRNAKNRGDQYIIAAMSLMAVYNVHAGGIP